MLEFITVKTLDRNGENLRNVTISYNGRSCKLLGNLEHSTELIIDQELVNNLQKLVGLQNEELIK